MNKDERRPDNQVTVKENKSSLAKLIKSKIYNKANLIRLGLITTGTLIEAIESWNEQTLI